MCLHSLTIPPRFYGLRHLGAIISEPRSASFRRVQQHYTDTRADIAWQAVLVDTEQAHVSTHNSQVANDAKGVRLVYAQHTTKQTDTISGT